MDNIGNIWGMQDVFYEVYCVHVYPVGEENHTEGTCRYGPGIFLSL